MDAPIVGQLITSSVTNTLISPQDQEIVNAVIQSIMKDVPIEIKPVSPPSNEELLKELLQVVNQVKAPLTIEIPKDSPQGTPKDAVMAAPKTSPKASLQEESEDDMPPLVSDEDDMPPLVPSSDSEESEESEDESEYDVSEMMMAVFKNPECEQCDEAIHAVVKGKHVHLNDTCVPNTIYHFSILLIILFIGSYVTHESPIRYCRPY